MDVKKLSFEELVGVINLYPWFGGARKEMCRRMRDMGDNWDMSQYADAALYVGERSKISDIVRGTNQVNWTDADVEKLLKSYISEKQTVTVQPQTRRVYAGVGDYFSQEEYDNVRVSEDNVFSRYAAKVRKEKPEPVADIKEELQFYTETLAQIYAEQGYYEQSKRIYSKLILAYPEKSAYFASLIQKIEEFNKIN